MDGMHNTALDIHAHYYPLEYMTLCRQLGVSPSPVAADARLTYQHPQRARDPMFTGALDERVAMMDAARIATQFLSFAAPNLWHPDQSERTRLVRAFNDGCLAACRAYPGRFKLLANVPLPFVQPSLAESDRLLDDPDVVGIGMPAYVPGMAIDDEQLAPLYSAWNERGAAVFVHPDRFCAPGILADHGMEWSLGAPFDDTIAVLRLARSGIAARHERITWIVPHLGGTLPMLYDRIEQLGQHAGPGGTPLPALDLTRFLFDTCTPSPRALRLAVDVLGTDALVLGTDFPYVNRDDLGAGERVLHAAGLSQEQVQAVLAGNLATALAPVGGLA